MYKPSIKQETVNWNDETKIVYNYIIVDSLGREYTSKFGDTLHYPSKEAAEKHCKQLNKKVWF